MKIVFDFRYIHPKISTKTGKLNAVFVLLGPNMGDVMRLRKLAQDNRAIRGMLSSDGVAQHGGHNRNEAKFIFCGSAPSRAPSIADS